MTTTPVFPLQAMAETAARGFHPRPPIRAERAGLVRHERATCRYAIAP